MLLAPIASRRSPRAFDPHSRLNAMDLHPLLEAARWAPSAMNRQPWAFLVGFRGDGTFKGTIDALKPGNQLWAGAASALLTVLVDGGDSASLSPMRAYEVGLAVGQLGIQAEHQGLITHQMAGFEPDQLRAEFSLPEGLHPLVVVAVGRRGDADALPEALRSRESAPRLRRPVSDFAFTGDSWRRNVA